MLKLSNFQAPKTYEPSQSKNEEKTKVKADEEGELNVISNQKPKPKNPDGNKYFYYKHINI